MSTETFEWSVCQLFEKGRNYHIFVTFCTMPDVFFTEIRGTQWKLNWDYFPLWYSKNLPCTSSIRQKAFFIPQLLHSGDTGLLKRNKTVEKRSSSLHILQLPALFLPVISLGTHLSLMAATTNWKRLLPPTPPACPTPLLSQRITQICQPNSSERCSLTHVCQNQTTSQK